MKPYDQNYIVPGDIYADETVLCLRCGVKIMGLSYKEIPKRNNPKEIVNVACKEKYGNYRLFPAVMYCSGKESIVNLPVCRDCLKEIVPERDTNDIVHQIVKAMQIEAQWVGAPQEAVDGIKKRYLDAKILRKLTVEELLEGRILQEG